MSSQKRFPLPAQCPVCGGELEITNVHCLACETGMTGHFTRGRFANLNQQQWHFIETFIRCKGKIKDVEVALDISYPTVVARLNDVVRALGFESGDDGSEMRDEKRRDVLQRLERGEIGPKDALRLLETE